MERQVLKMSVWTALGILVGLVIIAVVIVIAAVSSTIGGVVNTIKDDEEI